MTDAHVRRLIVSYLIDKITLQALDRDLTQIAWDQDAPAPLHALVNALMLRIDEHSSGVGDEEALKKAFLPLVTNYAVVLDIQPSPGPSPEVHTVLSSSSETVWSTANLTPTSADTRLVGIPS